MHGATHTGCVPQAELYELILDIQIMYIILEHCRFTALSSIISYYTGKVGTYYTAENQPRVKTLSSEVLPTHECEKPLHCAHLQAIGDGWTHLSRRLRIPQSCVVS